MVYTKHFNRLLAIALVALPLVGCQRRCQPLSAEAYTTFTGRQWRLIASNDPKFKTTLSRFTFLLLDLKTNFTGTISKVENNDQLNPVALRFIYNVDATRRLLRLQAVQPPTDGEEEVPFTDLPTMGSPTEYQYTLNAYLNLRETKTGIYYKFLEYQGTVDPDSTCTFY